MKPLSKKLPIFLILLVFAAFHLVGISKINDAAVAQYPTIIMIMAYITCVVIIIGELLSKNKTGEEEQLEKSNLLYILYLVAIFVIYLVVIPHMGFLFSSALFLFTLFLLWRSKQVKLEMRYILFSIILSIGFPVLVTFIFSNVLMTRLP